LTFVALCCIALAALAVFLVDSQKHLSSRRASVHQFQLHAREASDALGDLRAAQRAYVAAGQGTDFWMPKVDVTMDAIAGAMTTLRQSATSAGAIAALDEATNTLTELGSLDKRIRDYLASGAQLMAADVIFTEGGETAAGAARHIERARLEEQSALDAFEGALRRQEALALGAAAGFSVLIMALLALTPRNAPREENRASTVIKPTLGEDRAHGSGNHHDLVLRPDAEPSEPNEPKGPAVGPATGPTLWSPTALRTAAQLCTELGRMGDPEELNTLMARAADMLNASGLVLWVGTPTGAELRPVLAHGYSPEMVARLPALPRSADNAAAAAYRTGAMQIVLSRPGSSKGAIAAPVLSADGCVGVLSAEIRDGGEASDAVQALAAILAAQLSGVLASATVSEGPRAAGSAG
jgi:hypothetical protein